MQDECEVQGACEEGGLRSRKKAKVRSLIQKTLLALVLERGYDAVTVEDVCRGADVSKKTFFNYFPSKDAALRGNYEALISSDDLRRELEANAGRNYLDVIAEATQLELSDAATADAEVRRLRREVFTAMPHLMYRTKKDHAELQRTAMGALRMFLTDHPECRLEPQRTLDEEMLAASSALASVMRIRLTRSVLSERTMGADEARELLCGVVVGSPRPKPALAPTSDAAPMKHVPPDMAAFALARSADERITDDERFMRVALDLAYEAANAGEVPIGAVVVCDGQIISEARNRRETDNDPSGHAEFSAIVQASRELERWRLPDCTVYVTLEPCIMCAGLMHQSRIGRCVFGASDPKAGALGTLYSVHADERLNHAFDVTPGVLEEECAELLRAFFAERRLEKGENGAAAKGSSPV